MRYANCPPVSAPSFRQLAPQIRPGLRKAALREKGPTRRSRRQLTTSRLPFPSAISTSGIHALLFAPQIFHYMCSCLRRCEHFSNELSHEVHVPTLKKTPEHHSQHFASLSDRVGNLFRAAARLCRQERQQMRHRHVEVAAESQYFVPDVEILFARACRKLITRERAPRAKNATTRAGRAGVVCWWCISRQHGMQDQHTWRSFSSFDNSISSMAGLAAATAAVGTLRRLLMEAVAGLPY